MSLLFWRKNRSFYFVNKENGSLVLGVEFPCNCCKVQFFELGNSKSPGVGLSKVQHS